MTALPTPVMTADVTATSLHVRKLPGHDNLVLGYLHNADTVTLTGACLDGWAQILWQGATAWVNADYLSDNNCKD